jgi:hypothetical protein
MRVALAVLAALFMLAGPASAADPDYIGGKLSASPTRAQLTSQGTVPTQVTMAVEGAFTVSPLAFTIDPGETVTMAVTGDPHGFLSATLQPLHAEAGDNAAVTLRLSLDPLPVSQSPPYAPIGGLLAALAVIVALRRLRPWRWRMVRV